MSQMSLFLATHAEAVLFFAIFAEQIGVPLPAVPILVAAGGLAAEGALSPATAVGVTLAACTLADLIWFCVGRQGGDAVPRFLCRLFIRETSSFERIKHLFGRY